jgi:hemoglobin-like flavoprotein
MLVKVRRSGSAQWGRMETLLDTRHALMTASLDSIAEQGVDIVPAYFARFYAAFPDDEANFHNRAASQGAMVNEMLTMLLAQAAGETWVPMIMRAQVTTHYNHGDIALSQYRDALTLLVDVLAEATGPDWSAVQDAAWRAEADALFALISRYY